MSNRDDRRSGLRGRARDRARRDRGYKLVGRGDEKAADQAAVDAMRTALNAMADARAAS